MTIDLKDDFCSYNAFYNKACVCLKLEEKSKSDKKKI